MPSLALVLRRGTHNAGERPAAFPRRLEGAFATASHSDLDATIAALQDGPNTVSSSAAVRAIDGWITALHDAGMTELADTLTRLRVELTSGHLTGAWIGSILIELGTETEAAATGAKAWRANPRSLPHC